MNNNNPQEPLPPHTHRENMERKKILSNTHTNQAPHSDAATCLTVQHNKTILWHHHAMCPLLPDSRLLASQTLSTRAKHGQVTYGRGTKGAQPESLMVISPGTWYYKCRVHYLLSPGPCRPRYCSSAVSDPLLFMIFQRDSLKQGPRLRTQLKANPIR